jgi:hypothetical protein
VVFWAMENRATSDLLQRLDAETYSNDDAIVLTVPLALPYPVQGNYQRIDGDFEYKGESYRLVKQKLENDTLFIVCIKDKENARIAAAYSDFTKLTNNLPASNKKALSFLTKLHKDFKSTEFKILYKSRLMYERTYFAAADPQPIPASYSIDSPPPELLF